MNTISTILLGGVVLALFACVWFLLTQKNKNTSSCCGNCSGCASPCGKKQDQK